MILDPDKNPAYGVLENLPENLWEDLKKLDPEDVVRRALVEYRDGYIVNFLKDSYLIDPKNKDIVPITGSEKPKFQLGLILLSYLLGAKDIPFSGVWVLPNQLDGGLTFFSEASHPPKVEPIVSKFGNDVLGFRRACEALSGKKVDIGDAAFEFRVLPRIKMQYVLWAKTDEFEAEVKVLFDKTVSQHVALDVIWSIINLVTDKIVSV